MSRLARVERLEFAPNQRVLVISDVHGHLEFLQGVLEKAKFSQDDVLILAGDMIEKGPRTLETIRYIRQLQKTHCVYPLAGNYEEMFRLFLCGDDSQKSRFRDMLKYNKNSLAFQLTGVTWDDCKRSTRILREKVMKNPESAEILQWLESLVTILDTPEYVFVHGGVSSLEGMESLNHWDCLKVGNVLRDCGGFEKHLVVGHNPTAGSRRFVQSEAPLYYEKKGIICVDGGCVLMKDGQLNCLCLQGRKRTWIAYDGFPTVIARSEQVGSEISDSINIRFGRGRPRVKVLDVGEECSFCAYERKFSHGETRKYQLNILNSYLDGEPVVGETVKTRDFSNYFLPVEVGDELVLIEKVKGGFYGKKQGVIGWFMGDYEER